MLKWILILTLLEIGLVGTFTLAAFSPGFLWVERISGGLFPWVGIVLVGLVIVGLVRLVDRRIRPRRQDC